ncbi:MAG: hypothetical protein IJ584_05430 [Bacteroidales bacterium]|nr:hypothetical protein [Bacteroidales bacterium]
MEENKEQLVQEFALLFRAMGIIKENGMLKEKTIERNGCGSSPENPIVIPDVDNYVRLEYAILFHLLRGKNYERKIQMLMEREDGHHLDMLTVAYSISPDGEQVTEDFYFDISNGYNSLSDPKVKEKLAREMGMEKIKY